MRKQPGLFSRQAAQPQARLPAVGSESFAGSPCPSHRLRDADTAHQRLGRLQEKNWRAAACLDVTIEEKDKTLSITWTKDEQKKRELCGCYLLRTNTTETDPVKLWRQYIQLVDAEWAFRITKDEPELRPVWHQQ
jgi:hypothetical protein